MVIGSLFQAQPDLIMKKGQSAIQKVDENMSAEYFCAFHPHMEAKLVLA